MVDKKSILNLSKYCLLLRIRVTSERNYNSRGKIHMYGQICLFESILTPLNGTHEVEANSYFLLKKAGIKSRSLKNKSKITISLSSKFSYKSFHLFRRIHKRHAAGAELQCATQPKVQNTVLDSYFICELQELCWNTNW